MGNFPRLCQPTAILRKGLSDCATNRKMLSALRELELRGVVSLQGAPSLTQPFCCVVGKYEWLGKKLIWDKKKNFLHVSPPSPLLSSALFPTTPSPLHFSPLPSPHCLHLCTALHQEFRRLALPKGEHLLDYLEIQVEHFWVKFQKDSLLNFSR